MAESVDALVSNTSGATHPGSIPGLGTETEKVEKLSPFSFLHSQPIGYLFCVACVFRQTCVRPVITRRFLWADTSVRTYGKQKMPITPWRFLKIIISRSNLIQIAAPLKVE